MDSRRRRHWPWPADVADAQVHDAAARSLDQADERPCPLGQVAHLRGAGEVGQAEDVKADGQGQAKHYQPDGQDIRKRTPTMMNPAAMASQTARPTAVRAATSGGRARMAPFRHCEFVVRREPARADRPSCLVVLEMPILKVSARSVRRNDGRML
jgi:hypothetical protein